MSERILKALMQLFAILAKVEIKEDTHEIVTDSGSRNIVLHFLRQELNKELSIEYIHLFDQFINIRK